MKVICWWSGGITSAVACKKAIEIYGKKNCDVIMIDTKNEDDDTYRFKKDCEKWYGIKIKVLTAIGDGYKSIEDCWEKHVSLNVANGAICSFKLKRVVREKYEKKNPNFNHQVFGFEFEKKEFNRAMSLTMNHSNAKPIFPLLMLGLNKTDCLKIVEDANIKIPNAYLYGFNNNNCLKTGCVQGGVGYWKKIQKEFPEKFEKMALIEHKLTDKKGQPVTMLKDQSKNSEGLVFLKKHPKYPRLKSLDDMKGREVKPLMECNGFCGTNDLNGRNETANELNFTDEIINK